MPYPIASWAPFLLLTPEHNVYTSDSYTHTTFNWDELLMISILTLVMNYAHVYSADRKRINMHLHNNPSHHQHRYTSPPKVYSIHSSHSLFSEKITFLPVLIFFLFQMMKRWGKRWGKSEDSPILWSYHFSASEHNSLTCTFVRPGEMIIMFSHEKSFLVSSTLVFIDWVNGGRPVPIGTESY